MGAKNCKMNIGHLCAEQRENGSCDYTVGIKGVDKVMSESGFKIDRFRNRIQRNTQQ